MEWDEVAASDMSDSDIIPEDPSVARIFSLFTPRYSSDNNSSSSSDSDENIRLSAPCDHQYLGELEPVRGREIMDDDSIQKIPVIFLASRIILVPGQTFPLVETERTFANILKYAIEGNHIFGIIPSFLWDSRNPVKSINTVIGTTAEILAYSQTEEGYKIKAIGRQRFKIIQVSSECINNQFVIFAYIRILPEIVLGPVMKGFQLPSMNKFRSSQRFKCLRREASQSRLPFWVYQLYDEKHLVKELKKKLFSDLNMSRGINYSDDSTTLFFQLLKSVPIPHDLMLQGMALNNPIQRLRWLKMVLKPKSHKLKCVTCGTVVGTSSQIFSMSAEGPHGTYVNPHGYVHELITLRTTTRYTKLATEAPDKAYSWFPNYGWQILNCLRCRNHLGWKFTANEAHFRPREFYAIKNDAIKAKDEYLEIN